MGRIGNLMRVFVVSLDNAIERRNRMHQVMQQAGVSFEFFDALRGKNINNAQKQQFGLQQNLLLNAAEIGCMLSHVTIWQKMVDENIEAALLAEDDIHVGTSFKNVLEQINIPKDVLAIFRLETHMAVMNASRTPFQTIDKIGIHQIFNCHAGTAGYVLNRTTALHLLSQVKNMRLAIDSELFDPARQNIAGVKIYQCIPGVVVQDDALAKFNGIQSQSNVFLHSTIGEDRIDKKLGINKKKSTFKLKLKKIFRPLYLFLYSILLLSRKQRRIQVKFENV